MRYAARIRAALLIAATVLALWPISATAQQNWQRYAVAETGAGVDLPRHIFTDEAGKPETGYGVLFLTSDRRAKSDGSVAP